jgi:hypothetical protein
MGERLLGPLGKEAANFFKLVNQLFEAAAIKAQVQRSRRIRGG